MTAPLLLDARRPWLLTALVLSSAGAAAAACFGLMGLSSATDQRAASIETEVEALDAALGADAAGLDGEFDVWAVTGPNCADCASFVAEDLPRLRAAGIEVHEVSAATPLGQGENLGDALGDVLAENGETLSLPAMFWRRGDEWRAALGRDSALHEHLREDFGPAA